LELNDMAKLTTISLGNLSEKQANIVKEKLNGKTYMNFQVCCGIIPCARHVTVSTEYDDTLEEIIEMLLFVMACEM